MRVTINVMSEKPGFYREPYPVTIETDDIVGILLWWTDKTATKIVMDNGHELYVNKSLVDTIKEISDGQKEKTGGKVGHLKGKIKKRYELLRDKVGVLNRLLELDLSDEKRSKFTEEINESERLIKDILEAEYY